MISTSILALIFLVESTSSSVFGSLLSRKRKTHSGRGASGTTDHEALSFLFESSHRSTDNLSARALPSTRIRKFADKFVNIADGDDQGIIDIPRLLEACSFFAEAMVDVGQNLSARDMRKNIAKAEQFLRNKPLTERNMREVLKAEASLNAHNYDGSRLIRLGEESCAMGLLWIRRSLQFQYFMFQQLLNGLDPDVASQFAYENSLRDFHGWALQKVYSVALKSNSGTNAEWLARIGGFDADNASEEQNQAIQFDLDRLLRTWKPLLTQWEDIYRDLNLEDMRQV